MTTAWRAAATVVALGVVPGCGDGAGSEGGAGNPPIAAPASTVAGSEATLVLVISNQSFRRPTVFVQVRVDGERVVSEPFAVEAQHTFVEFPLAVEPGARTLTATADDGTALTEAVTVPADRPVYVVLAYWSEEGEPPFFELTVHRDPPGFD